MNKQILLCIIILSIIPLVMGIESLGTFEQGDAIELKQICANCTYVNVSSVLYPNSSQALGEVEMTQLGTDYNYTFYSSSVLGTYIVSGFGDDNGVKKVWTYDFEITENGNENPEGITVIVYSLLFFIITGWLLFTLLMNVGRLAELNTDVMDVAGAMIGYFGLLFYYYFSEIYFAKDFVLDMTLLFIKIGGFTHIFLPLVSLILAMTLGELKKQKVE